MPKRIVANGVLLCGIFTFSPTAHADMVPPSPVCPPGSVGYSSHDGTWCVPAACRWLWDCKESGTQCRQWQVCAQTFSVEPGGRGAFGGPPRDRAEVVATCAPGSVCGATGGSRVPTTGKVQAGSPQCQTARYCVSSSLPGQPGDKRGPLQRCGCRVGESGVPPSWGIALATLAIGIGGVRRTSFGRGRQ